MAGSLLAPILIAISVSVATLVPQAKAHFSVAGSYPAVVCPGALGGGTELISLPTKNVSSRTVAGKSAKLSAAKATVLHGSSAATFVSGNAGSEIAFESISGSSTADTVCEVGGVDQWFIGGSGGITSKSILEIINSGLSDSNVQVFPFNSKAALAPITFTIKANSDQKISLATLVPGDELVALHIVTDSGRVTSYLLDHRTRGLHDLGSSFVTPVQTPLTSSYIAGLYASAGNAISTMRFLVPGNVNANVHLTIYANGENFTPIGFDSVTIAHQKVVDAKLPNISLSGPYGIEVSSDQPIFAAVLTQVSKPAIDFSWASQLAPIYKFQVNFAASSAQFSFIGNSIRLNAKWRDSKGHNQSVNISGDTSAVWNPQGALFGVSFTPLSKRPIYGGAIVANSGGEINYLPLLANQLVTGASRPIADLRALTRH